MKEKLNILFVDDDIRYSEPLVDRAFNEFGYNFDHYEDWEEAKSKLIEQITSYSVLIIDGKGKLTQGSKGDDPKHLSVVLNDLKELKGKGLFIPYVINTAYYEELSTYFEEERMVTKNEQDKLFEIIKELASGSELEKLKVKYFNAFIPFNENIIDKKYQHILIEILSCLEAEDYRKKNLNVIRDLLEAFFLTLMDDYECIPESFKNHRGNPNHAWCTRYFTGQSTKDGDKKSHTIEFDIPNHISWSISYVKEISNGFSHLSEDEKLKNPYISSVYAMITILEWLPGFISENFE